MVWQLLGITFVLYYAWQSVCHDGTPIIWVSLTCCFAGINPTCDKGDPSMTAVERWRAVQATIAVTAWDSHLNQTSLADANTCRCWSWVATLPLDAADEARGGVMGSI